MGHAPFLVLLLTKSSDGLLPYVENNQVTRRRNVHPEFPAPEYRGAREIAATNQEVFLI